MLIWILLDISLKLIRNYKSESASKITCANCGNLQSMKLRPKKINCVQSQTASQGYPQLSWFLVYVLHTNYWLLNWAYGRHPMGYLLGSKKDIKQVSLWAPISSHPECLNFQ